MSVYADILFLISFAFDAEIMLVLCKLYSKKVPVFGFLLSTCIGGLSGVFAFIPYFEILSGPPARFILPLLMVYLVFCRDGARRIVSAWIGFLIVSFVLSGAATYFDMPVYTALLLPVPIYISLFIVKGNIKKKRYMAVLSYKNKKINIDGFLDSGNLLTSFGFPVILGNKEIFSALLGEGFCPEAICEWVDIEDIRSVNYKSLGKNGTLIGVRLDFAEVSGKKYENVVLAYSGEELCERLILNGVMT